MQPVVKTCQPIAFAAHHHISATGGNCEVCSPSPDSSALLLPTWTWWSCCFDRHRRRTPPVSPGTERAERRLPDGHMRRRYDREADDCGRSNSYRDRHAGRDDRNRSAAPRSSRQARDYRDRSGSPRCVRVLKPMRWPLEELAMYAGRKTGYCSVPSCQQTHAWKLIPPILLAWR